MLKLHNNFRAKIFEDIDRMINPDSLINLVVYDLDEVIKDNEPDTRIPLLRNMDISRYVLYLHYVMPENSRPLGNTVVPITQ